MTFLFKKKVIALFLLPLMGLTKSKTKIYDLEASYKKHTDRIELGWKRDAPKKDEIIEIQRSIYNKNSYIILPLTEEQKRNLSSYHVDKYQLTLDYYDYRIRVLSKKDTSLWSNLAKGALMPVADFSITDLKSTRCKAELSLDSVIQREVGIYELNFAHQHDCGKSHSIYVFLSKDRELDVKTDLTLEILESQSTALKVKIPADMKGYEFMILVIGNKLDVLKIKP